MGPEGRGDEFGAALAELRESGSALLVAGAVPDRFHRRICDDLLCAGDGQRLFVRAGSGGAAVEPASRDQVLELDTTARGAAAAGTPAPGAGGGAVAAVPTLAAAADALEDALAVLDTGTGDGPQVCVDSTLPLIERAGEEQAFRFLHLLTSQVRRLGGTTHVHLPAAAAGETALTFAALVDATVELRLADDRPEQRWHVHDRDVRSDWLPLDE